LVSIHYDDTHLHSFKYYKLLFCLEKRYGALAPARYMFPAKTIGYSQLYIF
jgi:hypothetical protein